MTLKTNFLFQKLLNNLASKIVNGKSSIDTTVSGLGNSINTNVLKDLN